MTADDGKITVVIANRTEKVHKIYYAMNEAVVIKSKVARNKKPHVYKAITLYKHYK